MVRIYLITFSALLAAGTATAQPDIPKREDRHPAYAADPPPPRVVPIERIHTFEQRWEPVLQLLHEQRMRQGIGQSAPTGLPVPLPPVRPLTEAAGRVRDVCERHNLRKVWRGKSWRCR
jgi:hypothetical protein